MDGSFLFEACVRGCLQSVEELGVKKGRGEKLFIRLYLMCKSLTMAEET